MHNHNQFAFSMPVMNWLKYNFQKPVSIFGKNPNCIIIIANDYQAELNGFKNPEDIINKSQDIFFLPGSLPTVSDNDKVVIKKKNTQLFIENVIIKFLAPELRSFLSIKTPLYDSKNHFQGTFGIAFPLEQTPLVDILAMINQANILSSTLPVPELVLNNLKSLTKREQQCASYLTRGIRTKGIANMLNISPRTVEFHIENMKHKLKCHSQATLIEKLLTDKLSLN